MVVDNALYDINATARHRFEGRQGVFTWNSLFFSGERVTVRWIARAGGVDCRVAWQLQSDSGSALTSTIRVDANQSESGNRRYVTPFYMAAFAVNSTCDNWAISLQAFEPPSDGGGNCDSSYPTVCIPPYPPDLDCPDIQYRRFEVRRSDPHGFDGDNDGIGCESG